MHLFRTIALIQLALAACEIQSQAVLPEKDFATLTVEEAKEAARFADGGEESGKLFRAAVRAKRLDLIAVYLEAPRTTGAVQYGVEEMPNSVLKDRIAVMMLKSLVGFFPWEKDAFRAHSNPFPPSLKTEPYHSVCERLLPGRVLPKDVFYTKASRMALAAELEAAIEAEVAEPKPANPVMPPAETEKATPTPNAVPTPATAPVPAEKLPNANTVPLAAVPAEPVASNSINWLVWLAAGILVVIVIAMLVLKRRN